MRSSFTGLDAWYSEASTLVASSPFLASVLAFEYAGRQLAAGVQTWTRPRILSLDAWLASCWHEARFAHSNVPALLSPTQELVLWRSVIDEVTPDLFDSAATARLARRAAATIAEWHIPTEGDSWQDHVDGMQFLRWRRLFEARCRSNGWMARAQLWRHVGDWVRGSAVAFVGFDRLSPAVTTVRERLQRSTVFGSAEERGQGRAPMTQCAHACEELDEAARWARAAVHRNETGSFVVFVPDLSDRRLAVERIFSQVFYPGSAAPDSPAFHVAIQTPLAEYPLIADAFLLLQLATDRLEQTAAATILRSPFLGGAQAERSERAVADLKLRRMRELDVSWRELTWACQNCPDLTRRFSAVARLRGERRPLDTPGGWSRYFASLLAAMGWPGDPELSSEEILLVERWKDALSQLSSLTPVTRPMTFERAMAHLGSVLAEARGLEKGDLFAPVQIVDASDATGLHCDAAFVTGLSDESWPPALPMSPLIPLRLQKECGMLDGAERERWTRALFEAAASTEASYVGRLAPIVTPYVSSALVPGDRWKGHTAWQSFAPASLDVFDDGQAPRFVVDGQVRGGTTLIKNQSLCPFKAFAEGRLRAQATDEACFGFDALERGKFIHGVLERIWAELKTSARLKSVPDQQLRFMVATAAMETVRQGGDGVFFEQTREAERERIERLVYDWLVKVEKERSMGFVVEETEGELQFNLAGLPLKLRMDRIDRLADGRLVLIDYKTGKKTYGHLECPRPKEPQLLVYAAAKGSDVAAVFFGNLSRGDLRLAGWSDDLETRVRSIDGKDWASKMDEARATVEQLARDFLAGDAAVHPIATACDYCGVKPLCRISEQKQNREDCDDAA